MGPITLEIPGDILDSARLSPNELRQELALHLYARGRLSMGKARQLAEMSLWSFRQLLASRQIETHYEASDLDDDLAALKELKTL